MEPFRWQHFFGLGLFEVPHKDRCFSSPASILPFESFPHQTVAHSQDCPEKKSIDPTWPTDVSAQPTSKALFRGDKLVCCAAGGQRLQQRCHNIGHLTSGWWRVDTAPATETVESWGSAHCCASLLAMASWSHTACPRQPSHWIGPISLAYSTYSAFPDWPFIPFLFFFFFFLLHLNWEWIAGVQNEYLTMKFSWRDHYALDCTAH